MAELSSSTLPGSVIGAGSLRSRGFLCLLATHFLVLVNDNMFRWLVVGLGKEIVGPEAEGFVVSAGFGCLILPYILFAAPAGYLADRFSKRSVLVGCKIAEFAVMALGAATAWSGNVYLMLSAIALAGTIAALYGAAKLGIIPEVVHPTQISAANGVMGLTTVVAVSIGTVAGNALGSWAHTAASQSLTTAAIALLTISALGIFVCLGITHVPPGNPLRKFPLNPLAQTYADMRLLASNRSLLYVTLGSSIFWTLAGVAHLNVDYYVERKLEMTQFWVGPLLGVLTVGVGIGSVLAGIWSRGKVELGITPLGALGIALSAVMLFIVPNQPADPTGVWTAALISTCFWLFILGISSGLYDVPLAAYIQDRSPPTARGSIISAFNFMTFTGMLFAAGAFWVMRDVLQISAPMIFLIKGLLTLGVAAYAIFLIPRATIRFLIWLVTRVFYRVRIDGLQNLPESGPALLVSNHISWLDGIMLITMTSRPIRFVGYAPYTRVWYLSWLAKIFGVIPVDVSPRAAKSAVKAVREALAAGDLVCIFPEGGISRTGQIQAFKPGMMLMLKGSDVPIIPVYLDELWGSIFSFRGGKFLWKFPRHWPYPVSIHVGTPLHNPKDVASVRSAVEALGVTAMQTRQRPMLIPPRAFLRQCRKARRRSKIADSTGADLTGGSLLLKTLIFRRLLSRMLDKDERFVGVLVPPSAAGVVANAALTVDKRVAVNLNYTMTAETINYCIAQCGIRHVLASRKLVEKLELQLDAEMIYLEDLRDKIQTADKIVAALQAYVMPMGWLERQLGLTEVSRDDLMTVIFTSGSTGKPKGVMLSFNNIAHNIAAIDQVVHLTDRDVLCGVLPLFHSLGYTVTLWAVLGLELKGAYHFTPLEPRQVGKLCKEHGATIMLTTPTFLRSYLRRCEKEDFAKLEVVVCGAEKLPAELTEEFDQKFGVRPVEGYGTTELSPLVSVNIPPSRAFDSEQVGLKEGTVGRPVPGVAAKTVHLETGEDLSVDEPGMLLVKGPNVMLGYLHQPEKTAEVIRDGWYVTGDVALLDSDGFIHITGRQSRFSKIGGEMVPHGHVEELLQQIVGGDDEHLSVAVTAVPDARKGERLIVLYTQLNRTPDEICRELAAKGLPNLWIPSPDSFFQVETIPVLGTGKLNLQKVKQLAAEQTANATTK